VEAFYQEHKIIVNQAHDLCDDLNQMWDRYPRQPYGLVRDEIQNKIGGERGDLACFLEVFRLLERLVAVMEGSEEDRVKRIEAIVQEMRDYCSTDLPRLSRSFRGSYFDERASPLLQPVRLARKRVEAVRQHLAAAELFKTETTKEASFCSPVLVSLLAEAVQHEEALRQLQVLPRCLPFDTHITECRDELSLPVAIAANAPVINKTVSVEQHWHENPAEVSRSYSSVKERQHESSCLDSRQAWSPSSSAGTVWMEMDLGAIKPVAGVVTQCSYVRRIQNDQSLCEIEVEHKTRKDQEWVATVPKCFECKSGDQKVEHAFAVPIKAQYVRIHIKECTGGVSICAGVLERPRTKMQGEIVSVKSSQSEAGRCLVAFAPGVKWEEVGAEVRQTATEIGNEKLAAALRHKAEFSREELDEFDMSNLTYASYIKVEDKYFQPAATKSYNVDDLVDVRSTELASTLEDHFAREVARLKDVYQAGGAAAKLSAFPQAVEKVRSRLEGELKTWDKETKMRTDESEVEKKEVQSLSRTHEDWLKVVFDSGHCTYLRTFWNLDTDEPRGSICELDTHRWYFLRRFLKGAGGKKADVQQTAPYSASCWRRRSL